MDGELSAADLDAALAGEEPPLVVDIRSPPQFDRGHIPDSLNLPLPELAREVDQVADADEVVTVCPHGKASVQAANLIASYEDFEGSVYSLAPGLEGWNGALATGRDEGGPADSVDAPF